MHTYMHAYLVNSCKVSPGRSIALLPVSGKLGSEELGRRGLNVAGVEHLQFPSLTVKHGGVVESFWILRFWGEIGFYRTQVASRTI